MCGAVGCRDEAKKKEDEVGHTQQLSELFVDDLLPERHLLLRVPPEPIPTDDILRSQTCRFEKQLRFHLDSYVLHSVISQTQFCCILCIQYENKEKIYFCNCVKVRTISDNKQRKNSLFAYL